MTLAPPATGKPLRGSAADLRGSDHDGSQQSASPASRPAPSGSPSASLARSRLPLTAAASRSCGRRREPTAPPAYGSRTPPADAPVERLVADPGADTGRQRRRGDPGRTRPPRARSGRQPRAWCRSATDEAVTLAAFAAVRPALRGQICCPAIPGPRPRSASLPRRLRCWTRAPTPPGRTSRTWPTARSGSWRRTAAATGRLAVPEGKDVTYGLAEFVAAEEMARTHGFWWSPDGQQLLVARVDTSRRSPGGTSATRPIPTGRQRRLPTRWRAPRTPTSASSSPASTGP